jgi:hypothetical protein
MRTLILRRLQVRQPLLDLKCVRLVIGRIKVESSGPCPDPLVVVRVEGAGCVCAVAGLEVLAWDSAPQSNTVAEVGVLADMSNHVM